MTGLFRVDGNSLSVVFLHAILLAYHRPLTASPSWLICYLPDMRVLTRGAAVLPLLLPLATAFTRPILKMSAGHAAPGESLTRRKARDCLRALHENPPDAAFVPVPFDRTVNTVESMRQTTELALGPDSQKVGGKIVCARDGGNVLDHERLTYTWPDRWLDCG